MGNDRQQKFGGKKIIFLRICCAGVRLHGLGAVGLAVVHAVLVAGLARLELILRLHPLVHHLHGDPLVLVLGVLQGVISAKSVWEQSVGGKKSL